MALPAFPIPEAAVPRPRAFPRRAHTFFFRSCRIRAEARIGAVRLWICLEYLRIPHFSCQFLFAWTDPERYNLHRGRRQGSDGTVLLATVRQEG